MMKKNLTIVFLALAFFTFQFAFAWQGGPSSGPPSPPGEGSDGALVKDVEEVVLATPWFLFLIAITLFFVYYKESLTRK